jgi:hypothetical protein
VTADDRRDADRLIEICLRAAVTGPFFPDWEFSTVVGASRDEVGIVLDAWPGLPWITPAWCESADVFQRAVVDSVLNNLLGSPHGFQGDAFTDAVGATEREVRALLRARLG